MGVDGEDEEDDAIAASLDAVTAATEELDAVPYCSVTTGVVPHAARSSAEVTENVKSEERIEKKRKREYDFSVRKHKRPAALQLLSALHCSENT